MHALQVLGFGRNKTTCRQHGMSDRDEDDYQAASLQTVLGGSMFAWHAHELCKD